MICFYIFAFKINLRHFGLKCTTKGKKEKINSFNSTHGESSLAQTIIKKKKENADVYIEKEDLQLHQNRQ